MKYVRWTWLALLASACAAACGDGAMPADGSVMDASGDRTTSEPDATSPLDTGVDTGIDTGVDTGVACPMGQTRCGASCVDPQTDSLNCGACNMACPSGQSCVAGACACPMGQTVCEGACVDTQSSAAHCGACGTACPSGQMCLRGACRIGCPLPGTICGAGAMMTCVDATSDVNHCGACDTVCPAPANAAASCALGSCGLGACTTGFGNCDGNAANGCESNTQTSASHCGGCGMACAPRANAAVACANGTCELGACNAGFGNCDGNAANGCETNTNSAVAHCGGCAMACPARANASTVCSTGTCRVGACTTGFGNCDGNDANGCETNTNTSATNCGACGRMCAAGASCVSGACVSAMTTVTFPSANSTVGVTPTTTLGAVGASRYFTTGDFVTETFTRGSATTRLSLTFQMNDLTMGCAVGQPLSWAVKVNGATVGTFSWTGGSGVNPRTVTQSYTFAAQPAGSIVLRYEALSTVCGGGNSWVWVPGGTVTLS